MLTTPSSWNIFLSAAHQYSSDLILALHEHVRNSPRKPATHWHLLYAQGVLQTHIISVLFHYLIGQTWQMFSIYFTLLPQKCLHSSVTHSGINQTILLIISPWGARSTPHDGAGIVKCVPRAQTTLCCPNSMCTTHESADTLECHPRALKKLFFYSSGYL